MFQVNVTYNGRHLDTFEVDNETEFGARLAATEALSERIVISIHDLADRPRPRGSDGHNPPNAPAYGTGE